MVKYAISYSLIHVEILWCAEKQSKSICIKKDLVTYVHYIVIARRFS